MNMNMNPKTVVMLICATYLLVNLLIILWVYWPKRAFIRLSSDDTNKIPIAVVEPLGDFSRSYTVSRVPFLIVPPLTRVTIHKGAPQVTVIAHHADLPLGGETPENIEFSGVAVHFTVIDPSKEHYGAPGGKAARAFKAEGPGVLSMVLSSFTLETFLEDGGVDTVLVALHEAFEALSKNWGVVLRGGTDSIYGISIADWNLPEYVEDYTKAAWDSKAEIVNLRDQINEFGWEKFIEMEGLQTIERAATKGRNVNLIIDGSRLNRNGGGVNGTTLGLTSGGDRNEG